MQGNMELTQFKELQEFTQRKEIVPLHLQAGRRNILEVQMQYSSCCSEPVLDWNWKVARKKKFTYGNLVTVGPLTPETMKQQQPRFYYQLQKSILSLTMDFAWAAHLASFLLLRLELWRSMLSGLPTHTLQLHSEEPNVCLRGAFTFRIPGCFPQAEPTSEVTHHFLISPLCSFGLFNPVARHRDPGHRQENAHGCTKLWAVPPYFNTETNKIRKKNTYRLCFRLLETPPLLQIGISQTCCCKCCSGSCGLIIFLCS